MARTTRSSTRKSEDKTVAAKAEPAAKKPAPKKKEASPKKKAAASPKKKVAAAGIGGVIVSIEACKQWNAFKTRAAKIEKAVGSKATVKINAEKVRACERICVCLCCTSCVLFLPSNSYLGDLLAMYTRCLQNAARPPQPRFDSNGSFHSFCLLYFILIDFCIFLPLFAAWAGQFCCAGHWKRTYCWIAGSQ